MRRFTLLLVVAACDSESGLDTDADGTDGQKTFTIPVVSDVDDDGHVAAALGGDDCNDDDFFIHPGATEHCDGVDENCNNDIDEGAIDGDLYYVDNDHDGYGDINTEVKSCEPQEGAAPNSGDCDDTDPTRHPGAEEICNDGFDDDCTPSTFETAMIGNQGFWNLDDAIAASVEGGEIQLCPGVVFAKNVTVDKAVTIVSWDGTRLGSVLDGGVAGAGAMFIVDGGELTLKGLTIAHANDGVATALTAGGGTITVDDCTFEENEAVGNGGAIAGTDITIMGSEFLKNEANNGGAVYASAPGLLTITDSTFTSNEASLSGGAIFSTTTAVLAGVTLTNNTADDNGGGLYISGGSLSLVDTLFTGNAATESGGGLYSSGASVTADAATVFDNNTADNTPSDPLGKAGGGGAFLEAKNKAVTWDGGTFTGNEATSNSFGAGGGLYLLVDPDDGANGSIEASNLFLDGNGPGYTGGGIYMYGGPITLRDTLTQNNSSDYGGGTSINLSNGKMVTIERVEYRNNTGVLAAATDVYEAQATFIDCIIEENAAQNPWAAILVDDNSSMTVETSDFGIDPLDNSPNDIYVDSTGAQYKYGNDVSFTCSYNSGQCF